MSCSRVNASVKKMRYKIQENSETHSELSQTSKTELQSSILNVSLASKYASENKKVTTTSLNLNTRWWCCGIMILSITQN